MKVLLVQRIAAVAIACLMAVSAQATEGTWTAGDGGWSSANWDIGTGTDVDALTAFGHANRLRDDHIANVNNGATVDANDTGGTRFQNTSILNVSNGSTVTLHSHDGGDDDGAWTVMDSTINLDNGFLNRTKGGAITSGGFFMLGSWSGDTAQPATVNLDNGSTFFNDGVVTFGIEAESPEMTSMINIAGGSLVDLTGGGNLPGLSNNVLSAEHDIIFYNNLGESSPGAADGHNNDYAINFDGPGTLITDTGMSRVDADALGENAVETVIATYEDLWTEGYLTWQGGQAGVFSDYFTTSGTPGGVDYTLTTVSAPLAGDFDGSGAVGDGDLTLLLANWGSAVPPVPAGWTGTQPTAPGIGDDELTALLSTWGQGPLSAASSVPEPTTAVLALLAGIACLGARRNG